MPKFNGLLGLYSSSSSCLLGIWGGGRSDCFRFSLLLAVAVAVDLAAAGPAEQSEVGTCPQFRWPQSHRLYCPSRF